MIRKLSIYTTGVKYLTQIDPHLHQVVEKHGPPPNWSRPPGFQTLIKIILEQQVSLASAQAAYDKLSQTINPLTPKNFLTLDDTELKTIGFSRQKTRYCRILANTIINEEINFEKLAQMDDEQAFQTLTSLKGIGPWTAQIYQLMALQRPDVWPKGDIALLTSIQHVKELDHRPSPDEGALIADQWKPWRSDAARILWHSYLRERGR